MLIAGSLCKQAHLYIWDEPMNYIDVLSRIQLEALLQSYRPTILFVVLHKLHGNKQNIRLCRGGLHSELALAPFAVWRRKTLPAIFMQTALLGL